MVRKSWQNLDEALCKRLSPLGWKHINLTGDYVWKQNRVVRLGKHRPLRSLNMS